MKVVFSDRAFPLFVHLFDRSDIRTDHGVQRFALEEDTVHLFAGPDGDDALLSAKDHAGAVFVLHVFQIFHLIFCSFSFLSLMGLSVFTTLSICQFFAPQAHDASQGAGKAEAVYTTGILKISCGCGTVYTGKHTGKESKQMRTMMASLYSYSLSSLSLNRSFRRVKTEPEMNAV